MAGQRPALPGCRFAALTIRTECINANGLSPAHPITLCVSAALRETPLPQKSVAATTLSQASTSRTLAAAGERPDSDSIRKTFVLAPGRFFPILPALQNRLRPPDP